MHWLERREFDEARRIAKNVSEQVSYKYGELVPTADIMKIVENLTGIDAKFTELDFGLLKDVDGNTGAFDNYGAAMYVSEEQGKTVARIILNSRENPKKQRFSLVHELGHLALENMNEGDGYLFSAHIDMDLTSISDADLDADPALVDEQAANIFALMVLMPDDVFRTAVKRNDSLDDIAQLFGVTKDAVLSRIMLGYKKEA